MSKVINWVALFILLIMFSVNMSGWTFFWAFVLLAAVDISGEATGRKEKENEL